MLQKMKVEGWIWGCIKLKKPVMLSLSKLLYRFVELLELLLR